MLPDDDVQQDIGLAEPAKPSFDPFGDCDLAGRRRQRSGRQQHGHRARPCRPRRARCGFSAGLPGNRTAAIQTIVDKFTAVIKEASSNEADRTELTQALDRSVADGRNAVTSGQTDCKSADRQLADLERSIAGAEPVGRHWTVVRRRRNDAHTAAPPASPAPVAPAPLCAASPIEKSGSG